MWPLCSSRERVLDVYETIKRLPQCFWELVATSAIWMMKYVLGYTCTSLNQLQVPHLVLLLPQLTILYFVEEIYEWENIWSKCIQPKLNHFNIPLPPLADLETTCLERIAQSLITIVGTEVES